jgi:CrcB protein
MPEFLSISLGAILGANSRYWTNRLALRVYGPGFPYGTLAINVLGSLILGFFMAWAVTRLAADSRWRFFVAVGFCGGFTTFSSYAFESIALAERGQWALAGVNILTNNLLSLAAVLAGMALARAV